MKRYPGTHSTTLVLQRGEELIATLTDYAKVQNLIGAWLQSGIGGAGKVTLSFYDLDKHEYIDRTFDEPLEILSLQGNLAWVDGEPFWHIHGVFGRRDYSTVGGHVKQLDIALTGELSITPREISLTRTFDNETGLKLLAEI